MRIISGEKRGLPLKAVPGMSTRPTTDKVKESLFNIIGPYFTNGIALDLYAGSGGLGLEALSRGMERVIFVEHNRKAFEVLKANVASCKFNEKSEVYCNEASRALKALVKREISLSYVFLDPPYHEQHIVNDMSILDDFGLLEEGAVVVCEHGRDVGLPETVGRLRQQRSENYGETIITIYTYGGQV